VEIFFSHEPDIRGQHILLVEGLVHSGVTSEFLMNDLRARGAASVKLVTLLDRQSARRVALQPDYFGFLVDEAFLIGYGLGAVEQTNRNIPYLAASSGSSHDLSYREGWRAFFPERKGRIEILGIFPIQIGRTASKLR
jgi:hypoxanthine phosphoribosyltransferase